MTIPPDPPSDQFERMLLLHAHIDGELDAAESRALEQTLSVDPVLQAEQARLLALKSALQRQAPKYELPAALRRRLERQFAGRPTHRFDWRAMAASVAVAAVLSSAGTYIALAPHLEPAQQTSVTGLVQSIVAGHQRGLLAEQPVDVASSDRHTVKPWLSNKLATSPPVIDLADKGFALIGGRIDIAAGQPVPTLVYRRREHLMSLTVVPLRPGQPAMVAGRRNIEGYNVLSWQAGDFSYFAVSDMPPSELALFSDEYRKQAL